MIPMRDGIKLYTVIVIPKAKGYQIARRLLSEVREKSLRTTWAPVIHSNATVGNRNREAFTKEKPRIHFSRSVAASYKK